MIKLPIDSHIASLIETLKSTSSLILMASPGSGKTTRLPPALVKSNLGKTIVLVPKRIAAVSAADRITEENNWSLGNEVGYHVRFEPLFKPTTQLIFMTVGVFIKKAQDEKFWNELSILVFDEFHERSSEADIALGLAVEHQILSEKLKIIVMSATLNADHLQNFLPGAQLVEIAAPPHTLTVNYSTKSQRLICDQDFFNSVATAVAKAFSASSKDVLVFLPGVSEMRRVENELQKKLNSVPIEMLHGSIKLADQKRILMPQSQRRVILATDIAESSLTLPGVDSVVDSGLKKMASLEAKIGFSQLTIQRISLFSAKQRAGRAARTSSGTCYRLWHESDELSMPTQIKPEILTSNLIEEILTLKTCDVNDIDNFLWLDKPPLKNIKAAITKLQKWKLLDENENINALGKTIHNLPLSIENSLLFLNLAKAGFKNEAANFIAALETQDFNKIFSERSFSEETDIDRILHAPLNIQGQKIAKQLLSFPIATLNFSADFRSTLIALYFELFSERVAKRKTDNDGLSSEGRGVSLLSGLQARISDYYILLAGFNSSPSKTDIQFAVGFSKQEFLEFSETAVLQKLNFILDLDKKMVYQQQIKSVGNFIVTESAKTPVNVQDQMTRWPEILENNLDILVNFHGDYKDFLKKINFLQAKAGKLNLTDDDFLFLADLNATLLLDLKTATANLADFISFPLFGLLITYAKQNLQEFIKALPDYLTTPNEKRISIQYDTENAPMLAVKIQDIFGWAQHPYLLGKRLPLTLELLAPNMRPTQITQNLELFWQKSYFDIRKELRPRYPRHPWPDEPATYQHEKKK